MRPSERRVAFQTAQSARRPSRTGYSATLKPLTGAAGGGHGAAVVSPSAGRARAGAAQAQPTPISVSVASTFQGPPGAPARTMRSSTRCSASVPDNAGPVDVASPAPVAAASAAPPAPTAPTADR